MADERRRRENATGRVYPGAPGQQDRRGENSSAAPAQGQQDRRTGNGDARPTAVQQDRRMANGDTGIAERRMGDEAVAALAQRLADIGVQQRSTAAGPGGLPEGLRQALTNPAGMPNREQGREDEPAGGRSMPTSGTLETAPSRIGRSGPIGSEQARKANALLKKYKQGKQNLDARIVDNEQWWKMRHWESIERHTQEEDEAPHPEPASAWLFNSIANKHADAMDNYPCPNVLARAPDDEEAAKQLSQVLPCVLEGNDYEQAYSDAWWRKLKAGTSAKGVFWDSAKLGGLGDVSIRPVDILNLFWEPGICRLEDSKNLFHTGMQDTEELKAQYGDIPAAGSPDFVTAKYLYDDTVDETDKTLVIDWYYKKRVGSRTVLHYAKLVGDTVLYASENDDRYRERGFYDHGQYPFVMDTLFPAEGTPAGFGYIDVMKDTQMYIDKLGQNILENSLLCTRKRYWVKNTCDINLKEFMDFTNPIVHVEGNPEENVQEMTHTPLSDIFVSVLNNKIDELKETSGNRDFVQGGTTNGVTAASAIAALQESGSKLSRDMIKSAYRAFQEECYLVIELMRQFYTEERTFRITGEDGRTYYQSFDNRAIRPVETPGDFGTMPTERVPVFDVVVSAQKNSPYNRLAQNELAKELYGMGMFRPDMADQALVCMKMMDFSGKETIMSRIAENGTMYQQLQAMQQQMQQMAAVIDGTYGTGLSAQMGGAVAPPQTGGAPSGGAASQEHALVRNARERAEESARPA